MARGAGSHPRIVLTTHGEGLKEPLKQRKARVLTSPHSTNDSNVFSHLRGNKVAQLLRNCTTRAVLLTETSGARRSPRRSVLFLRIRETRSPEDARMREPKPRDQESGRPKDRELENPRGQGPASLHPSSPGPSPDRSRTSETKTQFQRRLPIGEGSAVPRIISDDRLPV